MNRGSTWRIAYVLNVYEPAGAAGGVVGLSTRTDGLPRAAYRTRFCHILTLLSPCEPQKALMQSLRHAQMPHTTAAPGAPPRSRLGRWLRTGARRPPSVTPPANDTKVNTSHIWVRRGVK